MIAILKYNAGNIASVKNALFRLGAESLVTDDPEEIRSADKVIFPGVGSAGPAMAYLKERKLDVLIKGLKQPVLGVCLGMQLMCKYSEEGNTDCLGVFDNQVRAFKGAGLIPHMGWNEIHSLSGKLFEGFSQIVICILYTVILQTWEPILQLFATIYNPLALPCRKAIFLRVNFTLRSPLLLVEDY